MITSEQLQVMYDEAARDYQQLGKDQRQLEAMLTDVAQKRILFSGRLSALSELLEQSGNDDAEAEYASDNASEKSPEGPQATQLALDM